MGEAEDVKQHALDPRRERCMFNAASTGERDALTVTSVGAAIALLQVRAGCRSQLGRPSTPSTPDVFLVHGCRGVIGLHINSGGSDLPNAGEVPLRATSVTGHHGVQRWQGPIRSSRRKECRRAEDHGSSWPVSACVEETVREGRKPYTPTVFE
jgi:hypothetical protein